MRRSIFAAMGAAFAMLALAATPVRAQSLDDLAKANVELKAALSAGGAPPRLADPAGGRMIRAAFDERVLPAMAGQDLAATLQVCSGPIENLFGYMRWGVAANAPEAQVEAAMRANTDRYQDEIAVALGFTIGCGARMMPAIERFAANIRPGEWTTQQREGLNQIRNGALSIYQGAVTVPEDGSRQENQLLVVGRAADLADIYAAALTLEQRHAVVAAADREMASPKASPAVKAKIALIRRVMSRTDCTGLCAL
ncbi:MAG: hypothetical protein JSR45_01465 [Proteobacteria bacterium]|nr:hypothetical protein [Pseudomonadota bacterium]